MRSPRLAALELKRFGRGKLPRAALVAVLLLPLLYGALYLWSFWDPYGQLDKIPVALVNDDKGATASGKKIAAGDEITKGLRASKVFEWHEVSEAEARKGVEDGTYYLSLTMPEDFSARIASSSGDSPETGALRRLLGGVVDAGEGDEDPVEEGAGGVDGGGGADLGEDRP